MKKTKEIKEKPTAQTKKNRKKLIISAVCVVLALVLLSWPVVSAVSAYKLVHPARKNLVSSPSELALDHENIEITNENGETLKGWLLPAYQKDGDAAFSNKTVITSHNYQSNREMVEISGLYFVRYLVQAGYNVVMFDYSGSGSSNGEGYTFGCKEKQDLLSVISYIKETIPDTKIALHGWAFGAASAILAGADSGDVTAIISDSSYADLDQYLNDSFSLWTNLPKTIYGGPVKTFAELFTKQDFSNASPIHAVQSMKGKNILLIHCMEDSVIPYEDSRTLYNAAKENNNAEIWLVSDSLHLYGFMNQEANYVSKVVNFLDSAMQ